MGCTLYWVYSRIDVFVGLPGSLDNRIVQDVECFGVRDRGLAAHATTAAELVYTDCIIQALADGTGLLGASVLVPADTWTGGGITTTNECVRSSRSRHSIGDDGVDGGGRWGGVARENECWPGLQ